MSTSEISWHSPDKRKLLIVPRSMLLPPMVSAEGSIDPLGMYSTADALAVRMIPGVRERQQHRPRDSSPADPRRRSSPKKGKRTFLSGTKCGHFYFAPTRGDFLLATEQSAALNSPLVPSKLSASPSKRGHSGWNVFTENSSLGGGHSRRPNRSAPCVRDMAPGPSLVRLLGGVSFPSGAI